MASKIEICNRALLKIGSRTISDLDESSSEARQLKVLYPAELKDLLRMHSWSFAVKTVDLAVLSNERGIKSSTVAALPSDCLKIITVFSAGMPVPYEVMGRKIYCNAELPTLKYVSYVDDPAVYDEHFASALSYKLAAELSLPIAQNPQLAQTLLQRFYEVLGNARTADAAESSREYRSSILDARN